MKMEELKAKIKELGACKSRLDWLDQFETLQQAWDACKRGDDMLWLIGRLSGRVGSARRKKLLLPVCGCARLALPYVREGDESPRLLIELTEAYARGDKGATLTKVRVAANVAIAADYVAIAADYAAYAANAAATAVYYTASYAARAAFSAYEAAYAANVAIAADYAAYAANAAAYADILAQCADIVRQYYTCEEVVAQLEEVSK